MRRQQKWYAAHILVAARYRKGAQRSFPVYENIVLFRGHNAEQVRRKAQDFAKTEYEGDSTVTLGRRPARLVFVGVRKIVECQESTARGIRHPGRNLAPGEGTEASYSLLTVTGSKQLNALAAGESVLVRYEAD